MKTIKGLAIVFIFGFILMGLKSERTEITYKGDKYYYCGTELTKANDTLENPGGVTIIKTHTLVVYYDHFNCK